jgi:lipopolysaccharide export system permease protein
MEMAPDKSTLIFKLYDGYNYEEITDRRDYKITRPFQRSQFKEQTRRFGGLDFALTRTNEDLFRNNYQMMNLRQLSQSQDSLSEELKIRKQRFYKSVDEKYELLINIDTLALKNDSLRPDTINLMTHMTNTERLKVMDYALQSARSIKNNIENTKKDFVERNERIRKHEIEWHRKFTLSIACLILFFIGAPLGAIIRKGGLGLPVVVSVFFFVVFHIISITGEKYARAGIMEPKYAMWMASIVLLPLGIFLTYKATSDSPILDADAWNRIFKKLLVFNKKDQESSSAEII